MLLSGMATGLLVALTGLPASAADLVEEAVPLQEAPPRFFPREEGDGNLPRVLRGSRQRVAACLPRRVPVPTNEPGDPSYVGSAYGLGKPSVYGFTPPLGVDDPFGRPVLRYCP